MENGAAQLTPGRTPTQLTHPTHPWIWNRRGNSFFFFGGIEQGGKMEIMYCSIGNIVLLYSVVYCIYPRLV